MTQNSWETDLLNADGELLIGSGSGRPVGATITAGSANITITNGAGSITISTNDSATQWVQISSSTASSSSSIDFTSLSSTYISYWVFIQDLVPASDGTTLYLRTSTDNGTSFDSGASDYDWEWISSDTSANTPTVDTADSEITLTDTDIGTGTNEKLSGHVTIFNPSASNYTKAVWDVAYMNSSSAALKTVSGGGYRVSTTAVDAIRFIMSSGNIASGTFVLYGLKAA